MRLHCTRPPRQAVHLMILALAIVLTFVAAQASPLREPPGETRSAFRKAPYLIFHGDPAEIHVMWQLVDAAQCTLSWGPSGEPLSNSVVTSQYTWGHQHAHTIQGLAPGALFDYAVRAIGESVGGTFRTPPPPGGTQLKFLAYGDTRTFPEDYDAVSAAVLDLLAADPEYQTFAIVTGDLVNNGGSEPDWDEQFFDPLRTNIREFHATVPTQALRGNHEGDGIMFYKYLPYPYVSDFFWSFDYGPAHVAIVDQYVDYGPGSPQLAWLEADLTGTDRPWKFIALHEPGWSAGVHENAELVQTAVHPLCVEYGVAAVFAGHNHFYARAMVDGVMHVTTGGGGAPLYSPEEGWPHVAVADSVHHFCSLHLDGDTLRFAAVSAAGELVDSCVLGLPSTSVEHDDSPGGDPNASVLSLHRAAPTPFSEATSISLSMAMPGHVTVTIYDVIGRRVAAVADEELPAGEHAFIWSGCDDAGHPLASGIYFCVARSGAAADRTRLVLLR